MRVADELVPGGVIAPHHAAGVRVERIDEHALGRPGAGSHVDQAVEHGHAATQRPPRDEAAVAHHEAAVDACAERPEHVPGRSLETVEVPVVRGDVTLPVGDRGCKTDRAARGEAPAQRGGLEIEGSQRIVGRGTEEHQPVGDYGLEAVVEIDAVQLLDRLRPGRLRAL